MVAHLHYIITRSRSGWSVSLEADRLSDYPDPEAARAEARRLALEAAERGDEASVVDLSEPPVS